MSTEVNDWVDQDDVMDFDTTGMSAEDVAAGSKRQIEKEGYYHCVCVGIKKEKGGITTGEDGKERIENPHVRIDLQVLDGEHPDQKGRVCYNRIYFKKTLREGGQKVGLGELEEQGKKIVLRWMLAFGLVTKEEIGAGEVKNRWSMWDLIENRQVVARVTGEEREDLKTGQKTGKMDYRVNFGNVWAIDDEEVSAVPKDPEALAMATGGMGIGNDVDVSDI